MRQLITILALLATTTAAHAQQAKFLCTKMNGEKVKATACEPLVKPTASPAPTPPPVVQCPLDRTFRTGLPGVNPGDPALLGKIFPYDQKVELCATLPSVKKNTVFLSSVNRSNASCNVYDVWLISPTGKYYQSRAVQPGTSAPYEGGQWRVVVYLDSTDAPCVANKALDLYFSTM